MAKTLGSGQRGRKQSFERPNRHLDTVGKPELGGAAGKRGALRLVAPQFIDSVHDAGRIQTRGNGDPGGGATPRAFDLILGNGHRDTSGTAG
ncbi:MAG TPA: hypothetical protein VN692_12925, partial [Steroidobacteraceae bacterium]|nr:hypothetical protein [Steroidobacteraceae bacterium]